MSPRGYWGDVPNQPFRQEVLRRIKTGDLTWQELARRMGCSYDKRGKPNTSNIKRSLGVQRAVGPRNPRSGTVVRNMRYDTALRLCEALNIDPWEMGL